MNNKQISVVINTYNAALYLERVLQSVHTFDEIVICDMHSTDATIEIATRYGCKIVYHKKEQVVEPARNFAIRSATYDWVLVLDADEIVSPQLREYLYLHIAKENAEEGLRIPRRNYFMGKMMRAAYPDYCLRFFKKASVNWAPVIHAQPTIDGRITQIPQSETKMAFHHLANDSIAAILRKTDIYTEEEIPKRFHKKVSGGKLALSPFAWFVKYYLIKKGFLDGKEGFIFAVLKAHYKFASLAKLYEYKKIHQQ